MEQAKSLISYTKDDLVIRIPVSFEAGSDVTSLDGGTVEAFAAPIGGGAAIAADYAGDQRPRPDPRGLVRSRPGLGVYELQVRATVAGQTRTLVAEKLTVRRSIG